MAQFALRHIVIERILGLVLAALAATSMSSEAHAANKLLLAAVTKWEVIDLGTVVAYSGEQPLAFVSFSITCPNLKIGGNFVLRTFSPSMQDYDTIILNGERCSVESVRPIRQN